MTDNEVWFGTLHPDGTVSDERKLRQEDIKACPHMIMTPEHYRDNGICRCSDPYHSVMKSWGYTWSIDRKEWV